jgi:hypothetical protein
MNQIRQGCDISFCSVRAFRNPAILLFGGLGPGLVCGPAVCMGLVPPTAVHASGMLFEWE